MCRLKRDIPFTRSPAQDIGFIDPKYIPLVEQGYPIVEILARDLIRVADQMGRE